MEKEGFFSNVNVFVRFIGIDGEGCSYFTALELLDDVPVIIGETTLQKFSPEGELIGVARLPREDYVWGGNRSVMLAPDGRLFHIVFEEEGVRVYHVELGTEYESRLDELMERVASLTSGAE